MALRSWLPRATVLLFVLFPTENHAHAADTLVVCPAELRPALAEWIKHRQRQGHSLEFVAAEGTAEEVNRRIKQVAEGDTRFVVLVGDADPRLEVDPRYARRSVRTFKETAKVNVRWGSEPEIASDNRFADLDGDGVPELAIGRLTADTPAELQAIVQKILAYERCQDFGLWRRQVNLVAGVGGFGRFVDMAIETGAKQLITGGIPAAYRATMTYGSWRSPYCPDPRLFQHTTLERLNEGCLFWVYIGHGARQSLDVVRVPGGAFPVLTTYDVPKMSCRQGAPVAMFLSCYTCAYDGLNDCLAEEMLRKPGGPVAVIGGTRVTMPYAMGVLAMEMLDELFIERRQTVGELLLHAKRNSVLEKRSDTRSRLLDTIGQLLMPGDATLEDERREHLALFNLIGDPLLRICLPQEVQVEAPTEIQPGETITVAGTSPIDGPAVLELTVRRDRLSFTPPARPQFEFTPELLAEFHETYHRANDSRVSSQLIQVQGGHFAADIDIPTHLRGTYHVRIFIAGQSDAALGSTDVIVKAP